MKSITSSNPKPTSSFESITLKKEINSLPLTSTIKSDSKKITKFKLEYFSRNQCFIDAMKIVLVRSEMLLTWKNPFIVNPTPEIHINSSIPGYICNKLVFSVSFEIYIARLYIEYTYVLILRPTWKAASLNWTI